MINIEEVKGKLTEISNSLPDLVENEQTRDKLQTLIEDLEEAKCP